MKKLAFVGSVAVLLLVVMLATLSTGAQASTLLVTATPSTTAMPPKTPAADYAVPVSGNITVVGMGKVMVVPDVVRIQVGVETISTTVAAATAENDKVMAAVLAALKKEGVADKDIQTAYYSIYPEYQQDKGSVSSEPSVPQIAGYRVSNSLTITIRDTQDMKQVSAVLEAVVGAGANNVGGISLAVDDTQAVEDAARKLAVADAKRRATDLAELTGVTLGPVMQVSEVITGAPQIYAREAAPSAMGGGVSIMPGEQEYSVSIQITYAIQ
ncbi:MAG: SIMPL domain-containing protein [Chloroflexi bacterium]|nr:SIMPL domain-containing protein [Chloroflexota bacterium]MBU1750406.1 SIMPL domain-containing protein [Chloroflexota bacterium]